MDETALKRVMGLMGLSVRAGRAVFGADGCLKAVRGGKCALLLLDGGASRATRDKYTGACAHAGVPLRLLPEGALAQATGRPGVAMALPVGGLTEELLTILSRDEDTERLSGGASVE